MPRATSPGQRAHPAGGAPCHRSPLGCDSDTMACPATEGRPAAFDPVAGGPTRTQVRLKRLRESDRGGGCSERPPPKPKRASVRPTGPPATVTTTPHAVHVKASSVGAGVVPRDAPIYNKGVVLSRPMGAAGAPALDMKFDQLVQILLATSVSLFRPWDMSIVQSLHNGMKQRLKS